MRSQAVSIVLVSAALCACSTYEIPRYSASSDTVARLRALPPTKVSVGQITGTRASETQITCRGVGPIKAPDGQTFGQYIGGGLRSELQMAGLFDANSPIVLSGTLDQLDFSSGISDAAWQLTLTVKSTNGKQVGAANSYRFTGSFMGDTACNQTAQAGFGAVQTTIEKVVADPGFRALIAPAP